MAEVFISMSAVKFSWTAHSKSSRKQKEMYNKRYHTVADLSLKKMKSKLDYAFFNRLRVKANG